MRTTIVAVLVAMACFVSASPSFGQNRLWTAPKAGIWTVAAKDDDGTTWSGQLHLTRNSIKGTKVGYRGYFYWISGDRATSGNEYFNGSFNRSSGRLRLHGYRAKSVRGELGTGDYRASGIRGQRLVRGSWGGQDSIPGSWRAVWHGSR